MGDIEKIFNICKKYSFSDYYFYGNIPAKKLNNAILSFSIPLEDEVIALVDSTLLGSCKTGLAVCMLGIYWKNSWTTDSKENYLSWEKLRKAEILLFSKAGSSVEDVQIGRENYFWTMHKLEVLNLLKDLQCNLKGDFFKSAETFFDSADKKVNQVNGFMDKAISFLDNIGTTLDELTDKLPKENKVIEVKGFHELSNDSSQYVTIENTSEVGVCPPPLPQSEKWHIAINGQQEGPYDISTIKNLIIERSISKTKCFVWKKGMTNWNLIGKVDEFYEMLNDVESMVPPPPPIK